MEPHVADTSMRDVTRHPWRWALPAGIYLGILGLSSMPASQFEPLDLPDWMSYLAHAVEYGALGAALRWALDGRPHAWAITVGLALLLGAGDEALQSTVPGRHPSALDLAVDVTAAGITAAAVGRWLRAGQSRLAGRRASPFE